MTNEQMDGVIQAVEVFKDNHNRRSDAFDRRLKSAEAAIREMETKANRIGATTGATFAGQADSEERKAFAGFLRTGTVPETRGMSIGSDPDGGYLVPPSLQGALDSVLTRYNPFRGLVKVQPVGSDKPELLIGQADAAAAWVGETDARPATTTPTIAKITPAMGESYCNLPASQRLLEDSMVDMEAWLIEEAGRQFGLAESAAIVSGNGTDKPKGFLTYTLAANPTWGQVRQIKSGVAGAVTADTMLDLIFSLPAAYRQNAAFIAAPTAVAAIRKLKDLQDRPLWEPGMGANPPTLYGYRIFECEDMPALAAGSHSIAFADWARAYVLADRRVNTVLRDPFSDKPNVNFYCRYRIGGALYDSKAIAVYTAAV